MRSSVLQMRCLYCGTPLALLRILANGSFCSDEHRDLHEQESAVPPAANLTLVERRPDPRRASGPVEPPCRSASAPLEFAIYVVARAREEERPRNAVNPPALPAGAKSLARPTPRSFPADLTPRGGYLRPVGALLRSRIPALASGAAHRIGSSWPPALAARVASKFLVAIRLDQTKRAIRIPVMTLPLAGKPLIPPVAIRPTALEQIKNIAEPLALPKTRGYGPIPIDLSRLKLREIWQNMPSDLKIIALVIPMILLLTLNAAGPKLYTIPVAIKAKASPEPVLDGMLTRQWSSFRKSISSRAGVHYTDDFRSGLDAWTVGASEAKWSYDSMGFVRPGALALFKPTLSLTDYEVEFLARIEQKGLGFVFRAADAGNYQAVRFVVTKAGPLPEVHVVRYTVLNGHETSRSEKPLPFSLSLDTFFTVHLSLRGDDFTLMVQDKMADFWSDSRLKTGGIGFLCGKGESAHVRSVEVSHQNDTLGRFCAYIASAGVDSTMAVEGDLRAQ
jgi:hypothetical protein